MAHVVGTGGSVTIGTAIAGIKSWTLDEVKTEVDCTDFASVGYYECKPAILRSSGTFEGYKDGAPKDIKASTTVALSLQESSTPTQEWSGTAYIFGRHVSNSFDGLVTYSYDFTFTGEVTGVPTT